MALNEATPDLDVVVLCGGPGAEREVSLLSGEAVTQGLIEAGWQARRLDVSGDPAEVLALRADAVFLALHGEFGEDGTIQALLDRTQIPYVGSGPAACALAMDKDASKRAFVEGGIPTPAWTVVTSAQHAKEQLLAAGLSLPVVVKPVSRGSSVGVGIVHEDSELAPAVTEALAEDDRVMIESFVLGRELTVGLLDGQALPVIELETDRVFYDYQAKYYDKNTRYLCPASLAGQLTRDVQCMSLNVSTVLGIEHFGRVDLLLGEDGPQVLEANLIPGFTSHSLLPLAAREAGFSFAELCTRILRLALARSRSSV